MSRTGFVIIRLLAAMLLVGLLIAGGFFIYQSGQAQGYALGTAAANSGTTAPNPVVPYYPMTPWGWPGYYGPHFFMFAPFFLCGAVFFFFFLVGGLFRFGHHGRHGDWEHAHWVKHTHTTPGPEQVSDQPQAPANPAE